QRQAQTHRNRRHCSPRGLGHRHRTRGNARYSLAHLQRRRDRLPRPAVLVQLPRALTPPFPHILLGGDPCIAHAARSTTSSTGSQISAAVSDGSLLARAAVEGDVVLADSSMLTTVSGAREFTNLLCRRQQTTGETGISQSRLRNGAARRSV